MNLDAEWARVRVGAGTMAGDRYSWLRTADPCRVALRHRGSSQLVLLRQTHRVVTRARALRVDEAIAVLDVQFAIDGIHPHDRRHPMLGFYFDPATKQVSLRPSHDAWRLEVTRTGQVLGERVWWRCPSCGRRRRFLYYFVVAAAPEPRPVLGCRTCLGLTYSSRARHRCADQDHRAASEGDEAAIDRIHRRVAREAQQHEVAREHLHSLAVTLRKRLVKMVKDMEEALPRREAT